MTIETGFSQMVKGLAKAGFDVANPPLAEANGNE